MRGALGATTLDGPANHHLQRDRRLGVHIIRELLGPRYDDGVRRSQLQRTSRGWVRTTPSDIDRGAATSTKEHRLVTPPSTWILLASLLSLIPSSLLQFW